MTADDTDTPTGPTTRQRRHERRRARHTATAALHRALSTRDWAQVTA